MNNNHSPSAVPATTEARAAWLQEQGGLAAAIERGLLREAISIPLVEALILGLMRQGVTKYLAIFGHGSTALAEVLRVYEQHGLVRCWQFRNEVEMAHAGTALRWMYGETCAVVTSIGPGALQALAASLAAASNGIGVYHLYGDETTRGEGYNMQQIPKPQQGLFGQITAAMGQSYTLHTPGALRDAMRKGASTVFHPWRSGPFFLNLPINTQPEHLHLRLDALPMAPEFPVSAPVDDGLYTRAAQRIAAAGRVAVKVGGGGIAAALALQAFVEAAGAVVVQGPRSTGVLPDAHPHNMHVGGSKGSISGNYAMAHADFLVVVGSRAVCQSDCSGIGWPQVEQVVNINPDPVDVQHYNQTLALPGDATFVLQRLTAALHQFSGGNAGSKAEWLKQCRAQKLAWQAFKALRYDAAPIEDEVWGRAVMTQPQAIKVTVDFCRSVGAVKLFDAGDVQANGFQIVEDDAPGLSFSETGASYMGFAVCALLAAALADKARYAVAFTGDGSFVMNPQVLIDAVQHGVRGMIVLFDNRRMAAISHLQVAQYDRDYRTSDGVEVDYVQWASSVKGVRAFHGGHDPATLSAILMQAHEHPGLSLVHVPVYYGQDSLGGMGTWGEWNVGCWCDDVQERYEQTAV